MPSISPSALFFPDKTAGLFDPVNAMFTYVVPRALRPSVRNVGLKAMSMGSPEYEIWISSVACASSPAPASSCRELLLNFKRSGTVLSVTRATRRTESRRVATSTTAVAMLSDGRRWR